ncbi:MAG: tRNA (adenosine(37)-N6)-threonylcarbamoyltransferase complex ATPase subunit type 1 TsaE [Candidatus Magasanikbacteria bacterium]|nr:tRNA (adenosine(37)-N6)-threonylcarbamoyltransferase complex ATPase subunit type 1 TsaE [Candidatus Magasanikbacteria bacterium]
MRLTTKTEPETKNFGKKIASTLRGGDIVALYGELGTGKTVFTKGLAAGLGVKEEITSPTFTLMNIYKIQSPGSKVQSLVHVDTYRLKNEAELIGIGAEDYIGAPGTITVIEWPEKITSLLKLKTVINIHFKHGQTPSERSVEVRDN